MYSLHNKVTKNILEYRGVNLSNFTDIPIQTNYFDNHFMQQSDRFD